MKTLAGLLYFGIAASVWGNGGGYSSGVKSMGAFQPLGVEQVQMVSENLEIDLFGERAAVRIEYVLHNPGKKVKVRAGFPSAVFESSWGAGLSHPDPVRVARKGIQDFAVLVDGKSLAHEVKAEAMELQPGMKHHINVNAWHVVEIPFAAGQTRRIQVRYEQEYYGTTFEVSENMSASGLSLTYLFSAAGLWAGAIEHGTVQVRAVGVGPDEVVFSHPKRFEKHGDAWIWNFRDLEPTLEDDLVIRARVPYEILYGGEDGPAYFEIKDGKGKRWEVRRRADAVEASSFLVESDMKHSAENLMDNDRQTAWTEGVAGDGVGESVTLRLKKPIKVSRVGVVNGYAKSAELYKANGRVAEFSVSVNGGEAFPVKVPDELLSKEHFFFDLPGTAPVSSLKLTIAKVYPGTVYQDTCVSDVILVTPVKEPKAQPIR